MKCKKIIWPLYIDAKCLGCIFCAFEFIIALLNIQSKASNVQTHLYHNAIRMINFGVLVLEKKFNKPTPSYKIL